MNQTISKMFRGNTEINISFENGAVTIEVYMASITLKKEYGSPETLTDVLKNAGALIQTVANMEADEPTENTTQLKFETKEDTTVTMPEPKVKAKVANQAEASDDIQIAAKTSKTKPVTEPKTGLAKTKPIAKDGFDDDEGGF